MTKFIFFKAFLILIVAFNFAAGQNLSEVPTEEFCSTSPRKGNGGCPVGEDIPMETPLLEAVRRGNLPEARRLIAEGANVEAADKSGMTPLILAAQYGDLEAIKILLDGKAKVNVQTKRNTTPLIAATRCSAAVRFLLDAGAQVDFRNLGQETALMHAAENGNFTSLEILLKAGADIHAKSVDGRTVLAFAVKNGDVSTIKFLLDAGAKEDLLTVEGSSINLDIAALNSNVEVMKILLAAGANPNAKGKYGTTAITAAAQRNNAEIARLLIEAGADPNIKGEQTISPITWAANYGYTEVIKVLLAAKANVYNKYDWTPAFTAAARNEHIEAMDILLKAGSNIDERARDGKTVLMYAVELGKVKSVKFLIENGANVNLRDKYDKETALSLALKTNMSKPSAQNEIIQLLKNAGAIE